MHPAKYATLADRLKELQAEWPLLYRVRIIALALVGYLYPFLVLGLIGGLAVVIAISRIWWVAGKLLFVLIPLMLAVLKAFWVKFDPPKGTEILAKDAPILFEAIEELRKKTGAPTVHHVLISDDCNASITQVPRLGILGWPKNYLVLGLPLLDASTHEGFQTTLAHELGHLSGNHGKFNGWVYRLQQTWFQVERAFDADEYSGWAADVGKLISVFYRWYAPVFSAHGFVLIRAHEYNADAVATSVTTAQANAVDLILFHMRIEQAGIYFSDLWKWAEIDSRPPDSVYTRLIAELRQPLIPELWASRLVTACNAEAGHEDTHPSLGDRVRAMGIFPPTRLEEASTWLTTNGGAVRFSAADHFLGAAKQQWALQYDKEWLENCKATWAHVYKEHGQSQQRLAEMDSRAAAEDLNLEDAYAHACLVLQIRGTEAAVPYWQSLLERDEMHAGANYNLGRYLLANDDASGIALLDQAMERDPSSKAMLSSEIAEYYLKNGDHEQYVKFTEQGLQAAKSRELAAVELNELNAQSVLLPHDLDEAAVALVQRTMQTAWGLTGAYLAKRKLKNDPRRTSYVLVMTRKNSVWEKWNGGERTAGEFTREITPSLNEFPEELICFVVSRWNRLVWRIRKIEGSRVF